MNSIQPIFDLLQNQSLLSFLRWTPSQVRHINCGYIPNMFGRDGGMPDVYLPIVEYLSR